MNGTLEAFSHVAIQPVSILIITTACLYYSYHLEPTITVQLYVHGTTTGTWLSLTVTVHMHPALNGSEDV